MKSVVVYTSTRADFGILKPLIQQLTHNSHFKTKIFVTGTHLDQKFGYTISEIESFFKSYIGYQITTDMTEDHLIGNMKAFGELVIKYSVALANDKPDLAILLGDRFEALSFALACSGLGIPIVHLHGGELTFGAIDDKFRHCITKLAKYHFVATEKYRKRVIQMGEDPNSVYNFGALGVENALKEKKLTLDELSKSLGIDLSQFEELYTMTFHPETQSPDSGLELLEVFLSRIKDRMRQKNIFLTVTGVNSDKGAQSIRSKLLKFCDENKANSLFVESLGMVRYLSTIKASTAVLGNSSSGILEAHSLGTPAVNIGSRQAGRERESSVMDLESVEQCRNFDFSKAVELKKKLSQIATVASIFGSGETSLRMAKQIESILKNSNLNDLKNFHDL